MARTRYIKPEFTQDEDTAAVSIPARFLYENLWCYMDRAGVCLASPRLIKKDIFPYDDDLSANGVKTLLDELVLQGFLFPFSHEEREYYYCPTLAKHQKFHVEEVARFHIPSEVLTSAVQVRCKVGATEVLAPTHVRNEVKSRKLKVESNSYLKCSVQKSCENLYKNYPRKLGKQKGLAKCRTEIKTEADLADLSAAIDRYKAHCEQNEIEPQYVQHFSTFMGSWRDWLEPDAGTSTLDGGKSILEIIKGMGSA